MNIIIQGLASLLTYINSFIGDWGITIVVITIFIKSLLIPLSIKQKQSLEHQQRMNEEIQKLKERYKEDKKKLEEEMSKITLKYGKGILGCLLPFIQIPIMYALYRSIGNISIDNVTSILLPWVYNIQLPDMYYIIPVISIVVQLMPYLFSYLKMFQQLKLQKINISVLLITLVINGLFISQAPVIVGVYWIISGIITFIEQLITNLIKVKKIKYQV